ncbi:hypothetical protein CERSUDRAFT_83059 [Gelatoporia subvermispora B]|uniref:SWIM-type domain-containing protein n=1 Tax=Ceriporiopsis subvermispora (strain B) TaxID=914234 RepID=M2REQ8_CERS8|nr:hypothetical protein CERSUDRAFT_83059 [Gelatoporia subvermispora B]
MSRSQQLSFVQAIIASITPDSCTEDMDETWEQLRFFLTDNLILAALDLIDRESVIKYNSPWGRVHYEVLGSTAMYTVFPELPSPDPDNLAYCTCPAFAYSVLISKSQLMCKHVLATLLAERLQKCVERPINADQLASLFKRRFS